MSDAGDAHDPGENVAVVRRSARSAVAIGGAATVVCILPIFLTGAMAVQIIDELQFNVVGLGIAVAASRLASAMASPFLGPLADRLGATRSIRLAAGLGVVVSLGIALTAHNLAVLIFWLAMAGVTQSLAQPAANRLISNTVDSGRLGIAFGVKQSAPPVSSMIAGFSVPLLALTFGWRWAFVVAAVGAAAVAITVGAAPPRPTVASTTRRISADLRARRTIILLAVAFGLGTSVSAAVTTFYVDAATDAGTSESSAGILLAAASLLAVVARLVAGSISDRFDRGHLKGCAAMVAAGSMGLFLLSVTAQPNVMAVGVVLALVGTWGFNGVYWFALIRRHRDSPGSITGYVAPGAQIGGTVGPLLFGVIAHSYGYSPAFVATAVVALVAAATMGLSSDRLDDQFAATS